MTTTNTKTLHVESYKRKDSIYLVLVDEEGVAVDAEDLREHYEKLTAVGYHVKLKSEFLWNHATRAYPQFAIVFGFVQNKRGEREVDLVEVGCEPREAQGHFFFSPEEFHRFYELD